MPQIIREMFTTTEPTIVATMHPILFEHRDSTFRDYLELPAHLS